MTASHTRVAHAKQTSCLFHWLSVFTLAVRLFSFYPPTDPLIQFHIEYKSVLFPKLKYFLYLDIYNKMYCYMTGENPVS